MAWGPDRLDVFGQGTSGAFLWRYWDGKQWSADWQSLGGNFTSPPTVVSKEVGRLTIFGIDQDGRVLHKYYYRGAWSTWENLKGNLTTTVSVLVSSVSGTTLRYFWYRYRQRAFSQGLDRNSMDALDQAFRTVHQRTGSRRLGF